MNRFFYCKPLQLVILFHSQSALLGLLFFAALTLHGMAEDEPGVTVITTRISLVETAKDGRRMALDLPQNDSDDRRLTAYSGNKENLNQSFVLIPAGRDQFYICSHRQGKVICLEKDDSADSGSRYFPFGFLDEKDKTKNSEEVRFDTSKPHLWQIIVSDNDPSYFYLREATTGLFLGTNSTDGKKKSYGLEMVSNGSANRVLLMLEDTSTEVFKFPSYETGDLGNPPELTSFDLSSVPDQAPEVVTDVKLIPYFLMPRDSAIGGAKDQVKLCPIYQIVRYSRWDKSGSEIWPGEAEKNVEATYQKSVEFEQYRSFTLTERKFDSLVVDRSKSSRRSFSLNSQKDGSAEIQFGGLSIKGPKTTSGATYVSEQNLSENVRKAIEHTKEAEQIARSRQQTKMVYTYTERLFYPKGKRSLLIYWRKINGVRVIALDGTRESVRVLNDAYVYDDNHKGSQIFTAPN